MENIIITPTMLINNNNTVELDFTKINRFFKEFMPFFTTGLTVIRDYAIMAQLTNINE